MAEFGDEDKVVLQRLKALGFEPTCVWDVGASNSGWTKVAATVFPHATFHMFEPLAEVSPDYRIELQKTLKSPIDCTLHPFALGETFGKSRMALDTTFFGSSLLVEQESEYFPSIIEIEVMTLDDMIQFHDVPCPQLLKMDTQGYELAILKGGVAALDHIEVVLVEGWLTRAYGPQTPLLMEIALWLATHDFFLFDLGDVYRLESGILISQDAFFVKNSCSINASNADRHFQLSHIPAFQACQESRQTTEADLLRTEQECQSARAKLAQSQAKLAQSQAQLAQVQMEHSRILAQVQAEHSQILAQWQQSQSEIEAMQTSKFWRMRGVWCKFKNLWDKS